MAPMFSAAYDTGMRVWEEQCRHELRDGLWACDPLSGEPMQVGKTLYADDAQETNVTRGVNEMNEVLHASNRHLNQELTERGLGRNDDKEEHLVQFQGRGAVKKMQEAREHLAVAGRMVERARYLGNIITGDGSTRDNVNKRITAAKAGFQALYGIWGKKGIDEDLTREPFGCMAQGHFYQVWRQRYRARETSLGWKVHNAASHAKQWDPRARTKTPQGEGSLATNKYVNGRDYIQWNQPFERVD